MTIELLKTTLLTGLPSGSAINYYDGKLFLVGDDANDLLILDTMHQIIRSLRLFNYTTKRIPKNKKADLETASIIALQGKPQLLILGSASGTARKQALVLPIMDKTPKSIQLPFYNKALLNELKQIGIEELNIEGSTMISDHFVISNRGHLGNPVNHLIFINKDFLHDQSKLSLFASKLATGKNFIGVSELCYIESKDLLLLTLSSEATSSTYADGEIGNSYIGVIHQFSKKLKQPSVILDEMIDLPHANKAFTKQKIEGICAEAVQNDHMILHLVADNDKGQSKLFKIKLNLLEQRGV